jgi:lysophospholipase L1-like esterase
MAAFLAGCAARQSKYRIFTDHVKKLQETNKKSCIAGCTLFEGDSNVELISVQEYLTVPACNYGFRGSTTRALLQRKEKVSLLKPAVIVVLVGGNDLIARVPPADMDRNYDELFRYYKTVTESVYCISNLPVDPTVFIKNATLMELNARLRRICEKRGVTYIDVYPHLLKNGGLNPDYAIDPVHLNRAGQYILMDVLMKNLRKQ